MCLVKVWYVCVPGEGVCVCLVKVWYVCVPGEGVVGVCAW